MHSFHLGEKYKFSPLDNKHYSKRICNKSDSCCLWCLAVTCVQWVCNQRMQIRCKSCRHQQNFFNNATKRCKDRRSVHGPEAGRTITFFRIWRAEDTLNGIGLKSVQPQSDMKKGNIVALSD